MTISFNNVERTYSEFKKIYVRQILTIALKIVSMNEDKGKKIAVL